MNRCPLAQVKIPKPTYPIHQSIGEQWLSSYRLPILVGSFYPCPVLHDVVTIAVWCSPPVCSVRGDRQDFIPADPPTPDFKHVPSQLSRLGLPHMSANDTPAGDNLMRSSSWHTRQDGRGEERRGGKGVEEGGGRQRREEGGGRRRETEEGGGRRMEEDERRLKKR
eukprot:760471-Hanusia_phi.AAC.6